MENKVLKIPLKLGQISFTLILYNILLKLSDDMYFMLTCNVYAKNKKKNWKTEMKNFRYKDLISVTNYVTQRKLNYLHVI